MLQEIVVPVLHVNIQKKQDVSQVDVDILNQRSRLTTNNQTISFYQSEVVSEKVKGLTLKMGFYDPKGNLISDSVTMVLTARIMIRHKESKSISLCSRMNCQNLMDRK